MEAWTIKRLLEWVSRYLADRQVDSPRLSAELLLSHVLEKPRIGLYTHFNEIVDPDYLDKLHRLVKRAGEHEPVAYLVGKTEFYSLEMDVSPDCMIPRPETELLVQRAIEFLRLRDGKQRVCDLCTGSGCIAVAVAKNHAPANVIGTDISAAALEVAARNVAKHGLSDRVQLRCGDLFEPLLPPLDANQFDLITCNPPYVSAAQFDVLARNIRDYEPHIALFGGTDGLDIHRRIAQDIGQFLKPSGALMLEIGYSQGPVVREILDKTELFDSVKIEKDSSSNDRVVTAVRVVQGAK